MAKVGITETVLRDGQQSLMATRMKTEEMLPILEVMDNVGYHAIEMWGGATYDACIRFLDEDPWVRLRKIRKRVKNTKLQMLLRGQNLLGYRHYADDLVDEFVDRAITNGIDIIRVFDALNDTRNLQRSIEACNKAGGHAQGAISYTKSPAHDNQVFINLAKELEQMGAKSICIKDMAGLLDPYNAQKLITDIKQVITVPLELHTHSTSGLGSLTYMKAVEAGIDIIDTAISPFAEGTSQPSTEAMVVAFRGTSHDTGLDLGQLNKIAEHFKPVREKYIAEGLIDIKLTGVDVNTLVYQVPGGMLSNLLSQLKQSNAEDRFDEVLKEVPEVRRDLGYPPLVTPTSQIIGTQAVLNVLTGERYKMVPNEVKMIVKGMYGKTTVPISPEIKQKIIGDEEQITCRPADLLEPELENMKRECARYLEQEEDVLTQAMFPKNAEEFFQKRAARIYGMDWSLVDEEAMAYPV
ncbi:oxaloacetate decarboxylase subunit alpha [Aminipila luticellarii]|uniref:Oxaloacetate decarboxylase subunit alpha n=1 Tax=Aminipila luticellarii TaxID=2507160 RepID=A0A410PTF1_9FIRM|nr:oxaloacetate decarboxylase subunit alpha [Aminipila luticellarii]QAT42170.1 oxaloacetate decarboxylase subunit alpha [Aminipila luticellarii]